MKLINPSVEIWEQDVTNPNTLVEAMWAHIARCVRVCYQIDNPNPDESPEEYVKRVIFKNPAITEANHYSVLEHGAVYFSIELPDEVNSEVICEDYYTLSTYLWGNKYSRVKMEYTEHTHIWHISTNLRVLVENDIMWALKYMVPFNPKWHTKRITISSITDIGVAREFDRHRTHGISEESTRYCDYSKERFGNDITFIKPAWSHLEDDIRDGEHVGYKSIMPDDVVYSKLLALAEASYKKLRSLGWTPQQARQVLPLGTKVQTVHTAFEDEWQHFIKLRTDEISGPVHPNMKVIADRIKEIINGNKN